MHLAPRPDSRSLDPVREKWPRRLTAGLLLQRRTARQMLDPGVTKHAALPAEGAKLGTEHRIELMKLILLGVVERVGRRIRNEGHRTRFERALKRRLKPMVVKFAAGAQPLASAFASRVGIHCGSTSLPPRRKLR